MIVTEAIIHRGVSFCGSRLSDFCNGPIEKRQVGKILNAQ